jgi:branched-chain amino acid transport system substrate-binding protein
MVHKRIALAALASPIVPDFSRSGMQPARMRAWWCRGLGRSKNMILPNEANFSHAARRGSGVARPGGIGDHPAKQAGGRAMRGAVAAIAAGWLCLATPAGAGERHYAPGITDTEIKIGQTMPYSGGASPYSVIGRAELAYFAMVNDQGGVNGRKITLISLDDGYLPPKTLEQTRRLVEQDGVAFLFSSLGTQPNVTIHKYMNERKVPQLFVATGATLWGDYRHFPWTMGWQPSYHNEGVIFGKYVRDNFPDAKIAIIYQHDDAGRDYVGAFREGLGPSAKNIVAEQTYESTDPTLDQQIVTLQASGATVFFDNSTPKYAAQAIRKAYDLGWHPLHIIGSVAASVAATIRPAGLDRSQGLVSAAYLKDPTDPEWKNDPGYRDYVQWMAKYYAGADPDDGFNVAGYSLAQTLVQVLTQCGDDLSRENIMRQAANLDLTLPMLLPGIKVHTAPDDFYPIKQMRLQRFEGTQWMLFGNVIGG